MKHTLKRLNHIAYLNPLDEVGSKTRERCFRHFDAGRYNSQIEDLVQKASSFLDSKNQANSPCNELAAFYLNHTGGDH